MPRSSGRGVPGYAHDRSSQEVSYRLTIDAQAFDCPTIEAAGDILEKVRIWPYRTLRYGYLRLAIQAATCARWQTE